MSPERLPVFLARRNYRRRRLADAARLLPLAGALLFCLPLLWRGTEPSGRTVVALIYVFSLWAALIAISALISRYLRSSTNGNGQPTEAEREPWRASTRQKDRGE
jgi:hypothetical protein